MATTAQKQAALKTWFRSLTGFGANNVILSDAGGPRPDGNYIVFTTPVKVKDVGHPFISGEGEANDVVTRGFTIIAQVKVSIDYFGLNGPEFFDKVQLSRAGSLFRSLLATADLTYVRQTEPIPVPAYDDTDPRPRYRADVFFYTQSSYIETDYAVTEMTGSVELKKPDDETMTGIITVEEE